MPGDKIIIGKKSLQKPYNIREQRIREQIANQNNISAIQNVHHDGNYVIIDKRTKV